MQISSDVIKVLVPGAQISKRTLPAFFKTVSQGEKASSIVIELKSSRATFSSIAIELKIDGRRDLSHFDCPQNNDAISHFD